MFNLQRSSLRRRVVYREPTGLAIELRKSAHIETGLADLELDAPPFQKLDRFENHERTEEGNRGIIERK